MIRPLRWARLTRRGDKVPPHPQRAVPGVPLAINELWAMHGAGRICGFFAFAEPRGREWNESQELARLLRSRGYFAGIERAAFDALVVFARVDDGHALAVAEGAGGAETFHLLTCGGAVLPLGSSVDEMLDRLPTTTGLLFPVFESVWNASREDWVPKYDWGVDLSFVTPSFSADDAYVEALCAGKGADDLLEAALSGQPFALALHALLARVCGATGDGIPADARAEAVDTLVRLVRRRYGNLPGVPEGLFSSSPWGDAQVRTWAGGRNLLAMRPGPFGEDAARVRAMPVVEPIPDDARPPLEAPRIEGGPLLAKWLVAWEALPPSPSLQRVRELAFSVDASLRHAVLRRLAWDRWAKEAETYPLAEACRQLIDAAVPLKKVDLGGDHLRQAWPLILVHLVHATRFGYETSSAALRALDGIDSKDLRDALVALAERGFEWAVHSAALANGQRIDDATLDRLLPTLKTKKASELLVALVMGRMDDDRVYELALESLRKWPILVAPLLVTRPGPRTEAALRANLGARKLEVREAIARSLADLGDAEARRVYEETKRRIDESV